MVLTKMCYLVLFSLLLVFFLKTFEPLVFDINEERGIIRMPTTNTFFCVNTIKYGKAAS